MFSIFKRNAEEITAPPAIDHSVRRQAYQSQAFEELKREVQLFLHSQHLFPSKISVNDDEWAEITFFSSNAQRQEAAGVIRGLHRNGRITVEGQLEPTELNGWSARLRLNH